LQHFWRFETLLISAFASIALFLTGLGLYATLAATRTLTGGRRDVVWLILIRAALLVFSGPAIGSVIALTAARSFSPSA
jgi:hypothetical protein